MNTWDELKITATIDGTTYDVMPLTQENANAGYPILYTMTSAGYGYEYSYIYFYTLCDCDSEGADGSTACANVNSSTGKCGNTSTHQYGYCRCWDITNDVIITITYQTSALAKRNKEASTTLGEYVLSNNNALSVTGSSTVNYIAYNKANLKSGKFSDSSPGFSASAEATADITQVFAKALTQQPSDGNDYQAKYEIYLDAHCVDNTDVDWADVEDFTIADTMSETLTVILSTITITWEDEDGSTGTLGEDDYTVAYSISGYTYSSSGSSLGTGSNIVTFTIHFLETVPPAGYELDSTRHYFWFCIEHGYMVNGEGDCLECQALEAQLIADGVEYLKPKGNSTMDADSAVVMYLTVTNTASQGGAAGR